VTQLNDTYASRVTQQASRPGWLAVRLRRLDWSVLVWLAIVALLFLLVVMPFWEIIAQSLTSRPTAASATCWRFGTPCSSACGHRCCA
jgi:hypothetical protein